MDRLLLHCSNHVVGRVVKFITEGLGRHEFDRRRQFLLQRIEKISKGHANPNLLAIDVHFNFRVVPLSNNRYDLLWCVVHFTPPIRSIRPAHIHRHLLHQCLR